jgi:hypothetical protein
MPVGTCAAMQRHLPIQQYPCQASWLPPQGPTLSDQCPRGVLLGEPKLRALGVLRLRPPTRAVKGMSSRRRGSSSLGEAIRQT